LQDAVIFYQLFEAESSTYTYLIADPESKEAALIDSVKETAARDLQLVTDLGLTLKYSLDTHLHADHVTGSGTLRQATGAKTGLAASANVDCVDLKLRDGDELPLGSKKIKVIATPGHTDSCLSYYFGERLFSGDTLLIRGTGRTDFQGGSAETLFKSVTEKLFVLPSETQVYPGHDYKGQTSSTIGLERKFNPRLGEGKTLGDFVKIMSELKLSEPKKISVALPANKLCGLIDGALT
jgi:sulfur dioxygenase